MKFTLKDHVKGEVHFVHYRDGELWYQTDTNLVFSIPCEDTVGATFKATDKGSFFMRWIRKALEENENQTRSNGKNAESAI